MRVWVGGRMQGASVTMQAWACCARRRDPCTSAFRLVLVLTILLCCNGKAADDHHADESRQAKPGSAAMQSTKPP